MPFNLGPLLRRAFAAEAKFSAGNGMPSAADVLYRNPGAIYSRLQLYHYYRLQAQLRLDLDALNGMQRRTRVFGAESHG